MLMQLTGATIFVGFRQSIYMSLLWLIPVLIFPARAKSIAAFIGVVLWPFSLAAIGYFCIYQQELSQSVLFILFESNFSESSEYIQQYFVWWMIVVFIMFTLSAIYLWRKTRPMVLSGSWKAIVCTAIAVFLFANPLFKELVINKATWDGATEKLQSRMEPAVPWQLVMGYMQYHDQLGSMESLLEQNSKIEPLKNLVDENANAPATLVLVIGESTNRQHMSLYGYPRKTTPQLDAMQNELAVFKNVVSSRPSTIESLTQVLTFADQENPDLYMTKPSLMNLMHQAGYKTYWVTNQQTVTKRNTMLTMFSKQTDEQIYLNNSRSQNTRQYDEVVIKPFLKILQDNATRRFIVVHLLGTHMKYEYRYPPEFERFKDKAGVSITLPAASLRTYNHYDNAVLYNDFIVSSLIKDLAAHNIKSALVYLSDHGEDVFDSGDHSFNGRNEARPTTPMYTIPFIVWTSGDWLSKPNTNESRLDRHYSISDFIHTWSDLAGLHYNGYDPAKSLLNDRFVERQVMVGDPHAKKLLKDIKSL